jgi:hypothetical protein
VMGAGENGEVLRQEAVRRGLPVVAAWLVPDPPAAAALLGRPVVAFAGIGRPEKFFATLRAIGAVLVGERSFPDHHPFRAGELEALAAQARAEHAILVTTEKDMVRSCARCRCACESRTGRGSASCSQTQCRRTVWASESAPRHDGKARSAAPFELAFLDLADSEASRDTTSSAPLELGGRNS